METTKTSLLRKDKRCLTSHNGKYWYDEKAAEHAVSFFEEYLRHSKGEWAGQPLILEPWQRDEIIRPLFGWKRKDGTRRYRTCWVEVPRKNGKSTLAGGIALYLLRADREPGSEVYSAAADKEQAGIVFRAAASMVESSPELSKRLKPYRRVIVDPKDSTKFYKILSADAFRQHGLNAHGVIFDEVHAQPTRDLWDVLTTATGSRRQPLTFAITTAGTDQESICWELHEYARQVKEGIIVDESLLVVMYGADPEEDWTDEAVWAKANPNLGVSIKLDYLREHCEKAKRLPSYENTFRRLHLNQWTSQLTRWIPMREWDLCIGEVSAADLEGWECYAGLDLSSTTDVTALVLVFRKGKKVKVLPYFWIPEENVTEKAKLGSVKYDVWVKQGHIFTTEGNAIDHDAVILKIKELMKVYNIKELAFDRWGAAQIVTGLQKLGIEVVQFGQGYASMSAPSKMLETLVLSHDLEHGGHPVLRWMADNVVARQDPAGNLKPDKEKSKKKIDGVVALIMAIGRAFAQDAGSVYAERGFVAL